MTHEVGTSLLFTIHSISCNHFVSVSSLVRIFPFFIYLFNSGGNSIGEEIRDIYNLRGDFERVCLHDERILIVRALMNCGSILALVITCKYLPLCIIGIGEFPNFYTFSSFQSSWGYLAYPFLLQYT